MVIIDTEYTTWPGALESGWAEPGQHREVVQISAIRIEDFHEVDHLDILVRPTLNPILSPLFVELTGIDQATVDENGVSFSDALTTVCEWISGSPVVCMNADEAVFRENCTINGRDFSFPSFHRLRPFLETEGVDLTGLSSGDLHRLTDTPIEGHTHNALHDVRSMAIWLGWAARQGRFRSLDQLPTGAPQTDPRSRAR